MHDDDFMDEDEDLTPGPGLFPTGGVLSTGRGQMPSLVSQYQLAQDTMLRVQRRDSMGQLNDIDTVPGTMNSDALVKRLGKPGTYVLTPINGQGTRLGNAIPFNIDPDHRILKEAGLVSSPGAAGGGVANPLNEVQALVASMMAPLIEDVQARRERLAEEERRIAEREARLEDARVATLTLANDAQVEAASKAADAANARMEQQQQSFATMMLGMMEMNEQKHRQHIEALQQGHTMLVNQLTSMQEREDQRGKTWLEVQRQSLEAQQQLLQANNEMMTRRWDAERAAERERLQREQTRLEQLAARELNQQREHNRTVLALREQQAEAASGMGQLEKLVELKGVIEQLGGGDSGDKPLISQIVEGVKGLAEAAGKFASVSGAAEDAEEGIREEMEREAMLRHQQALAQQQAMAQQAQQAQAQAQAPLALPPPDPFAEAQTQQLQQAAARDPLAVPAQAQAQAPAPQPAMDPFAGAPANAPGAEALATGPNLPIELVKEARAAFRWTVAELFKRPPTDWQDLITGVIVQAHKAIVPYIQAVSVTRSLVEAGAPPRMAAQVVSGMKQNTLLADALRDNYKMEIHQINW